MLLVGAEPGGLHREYVAVFPCTGVVGDLLDADVACPNDGPASVVVEAIDIVVNRATGGIDNLHKVRPLAGLPLIIYVLSALMVGDPGTLAGGTALLGSSSTPNPILVEPFITPLHDQVGVSLAQVPGLQGGSGLL